MKWRDCFQPTNNHLSMKNTIKMRKSTDILKDAQMLNCSRLSATARVTGTEKVCNLRMDPSIANTSSTDDFELLLNIINLWINNKRKRKNLTLSSNKNTTNYKMCYSEKGTHLLITLLTSKMTIDSTSILLSSKKTV